MVVKISIKLEKNGGYVDILQAVSLVRLGVNRRGEERGGMKKWNQSRMKGEWVSWTGRWRSEDDTEIRICFLIIYPASPGHTIRPSVTSPCTRFVHFFPSKHAIFSSSPKPSPIPKTRGATK